MKASHFVIVLLFSDITLTSGFIIESIVCGSAAAAAAVIGVWYASQRDNVLPFDHKRLEKDLNENLYGQHIVSKVVLKSVSSFMKDSNPNKPLVLSFHGTAGVGKNYVSKIIARNIYKLGDKSEHFITFISEHHFPHKDKVDMYSAQLKEQIHKHVLRFPRTMFVFDEMDKMNPRLVETIRPFLDYATHVDGVSFRNAIFIFLSNAGGDVINNIALDSWKAGKDREELQMNSKEMETQILRNIFNDKSSGFWHSSLIDRHLVDHFVPFLPLELKHVRQCVLTEMVNLNITLHHHADLADTVARDMPFFPSEKIFSVKGCKSVRQKLMLYVDD
ncbi:Torsin-1A Dystonia 1 protein [Triplophysa tibetana]|uniref:Torsin n=1 Tax=Triplophysa tibetana TaxID=1572043 RepID=A0A5A9NC78_9TELE|nr:Torsin-1A Dystonia 1 protein [Triplophysa tibetana]